jgi:hypothetical protein
MEDKQLDLAKGDSLEDKPLDLAKSDTVDDKQLDHLMTYTTFHIGVYVTLIAALIATGLSGTLSDKLLCWVRYSVACLVVAGIAGGVIGSNIPSHKNYGIFIKTQIGFWNIPMLLASWWIQIEHFAFWAGLLPIAALFVFKGPGVFK